eukprot:jgi/Chrzof1/2277/Cz11g09170.t1
MCSDMHNCMHRFMTTNAVVRSTLSFGSNLQVIVRPTAGQQLPCTHPTGREPSRQTQFNGSQGKTPLATKQAKLGTREPIWVNPQALVQGLLMKVGSLQP